MSQLGDKLQLLKTQYEIKNKKKLTGEVFGRALSISQVHANDILAGRKNPSLELLTAIAHFFSVSTDYLLGNTDTPAPVSAPAPAETETSAAPQPGAQILRAAFPQRESAERCENAISVPRLIAAIAQLRAELSELDSDALSCADLRTISDLLFACLRDLQEADSPLEPSNKKLA